ncbi:hypothetical protein LCGC14_1340190 [marine sediment metagenome]|uniref:Uncharacterized protein n=1 Tax=marine sediment metagenome TaxID=412755 RepID=A0A0F9MUV7_9ZZZZ
MACEILDFRCIIVSELIGSVVLSILLGAIVYFIVASKLRWGFDTTILVSIPIILILGLAVGGFSAIFAFLTVLVGILVAWIFNKIIGN